MNAALRTSASDLRRPVVQPETNADAPRGFVQLPNEVLFRNDLSDGAMRLYAVLLHYARDSKKCWPSQERLAKDLGLCRKTIHRRIAELEAKSLVAHRRGGDGKPSYYLLSVTVGLRESRQPCPAPRQDCPEQMGHFCPPIEGNAVDVHAQEQPPPPPPPLTRDPKPEQPTAGGEVRRLRSGTADDLTDHGNRNVNADRPEVQALLEAHGVFEHIAAAWARTDYDPMVAGRMVKQAEQDGATGGKLCWRLKHEARRVEREIAAEAKAEERKREQEAEEERRRQRDREQAQRLRAAWEDFGQREPQWAFLLNPRGSKPIVSATTGEARIWALQNTMSFTEMPDTLVGRIKGLLVEDKVPREVKVVIDRAFAQPMPQVSG